MAADARQFPPVFWVLLACMTAYTLAYSFISKVIQRDPECQQWAYWLWYVTPVPILGGFAAGTAKLLARRHR